jgi:hypothetical protein
METKKTLYDFSSPTSGIALRACLAASHNFFSVFFSAV